MTSLKWKEYFSYFPVFLFKKVTKGKCAKYSGKYVTNYNWCELQSKLSHLTDLKKWKSRNEFIREFAHLGSGRGYFFILLFEISPMRPKTNLVKWNYRLWTKILVSVNAKLIANLLNLITVSLSFIREQK